VKRSYLFFFGLLLIFSACVKPTPEKSAEMQALLYRVNSIRNPAMAIEAKRMMDSGYAALPNRSEIDPYFYYEFYNWYHHEHNADSLAIIYADSMLASLKDYPGVEDLRAHGLVTKGISVKALNQFSEALRLFYAANTFTEKVTDSCASAEIFISLGFMLYEQQNYHKAIHYLNRSFDCTMSCSPNDFSRYFVRQEMSLNAIALSYEKLGHYDSARLYYQKTLDFVDEHIQGNKPNLDFAEVVQGVVYGNLGNLEILVGNGKLAEEYLKKSIAINLNRSRVEHDAVLAQLKLAKLYLKEGRLVSCDSLIQKVGAFIQGKGYLEAEIRLFRIERDYQLAKGNYQAAYQAFANYQRLTDSINQVTRELAHLDIKRDLEELSRKDELQELKKGEILRNLYTGGACIIALASILIIYLIRRNLKASRASVAKLNRLNKEITEQNANLNLAMENLESSNEEMQQVLGVVAHDLRSPIGSIVSLTEVLGFDQSIQAESKEHIAMIRNLGKDSINLMEGLLNMQLVNGDFAPAPVGLFNLLSYCAGVMEFSAKEKGQRILVEGKNLTIMGSRDMLWRVVINLLSNAIKFSNTGGTIRLNVEEVDGHAQVSVSDEGIGIPESIQDQVFDMLTKAKRKGTDGEKTHGLGLSNCKRIMELHGGGIWLESEEGKGTTFYLEFA